MQRFLFFVGISGKTGVLHVAPYICNTCYNRLFIGFWSDGYHMSMKCCFINMLHDAMKCARRHRRLHRHFRLFWAVLCQTSQTASLSVLQLVVAVCCCIVYAFVCQVDSGSWDTEIQDDVGLHMHRTNGSWWDGSRSFFFMCDAVTMIPVMIKQGPPRLGWPLFFSRKRPLGVSGLVAAGL